MMMLNFRCLVRLAFILLIEISLSLLCFNLMFIFFFGVDVIGDCGRNSSNSFFSGFLLSIRFLY